MVSKATEQFNIHFAMRLVNWSSTYLLPIHFLPLILQEMWSPKTEIELSSTGKNLKNNLCQKVVKKKSEEHKLSAT